MVKVTPKSGPFFKLKQVSVPPVGVTHLPIRSYQGNLEFPFSNFKRDLHWTIGIFLV